MTQEEFMKLYSNILQEMFATGLPLSSEESRKMQRELNLMSHHYDNLIEMIGLAKENK
jgi:hypothetical protein